MPKKRLCRDVSFKEKNGVYVFYSNFNYIFFKNTAALLIKKLLRAIASSDESLMALVPEEFLKFLMSKKILEEVSHDD